MSVGSQAVIWARGRMGKQVGAGECWDLVNSALIGSGGKGSEDFGTIGPDIDYIWGEEIEQTKLQPGDVIQTRGHLTTWTIKTWWTYADGTVSDPDIDHVYLPRPHHSLIVTALPDKNGVLATIEQNIDPKGQVVQVQKFHTRDVPAVKVIKKGVSVTDPNDDKKKIKVTVTTETEISVEGTMWIYRPQKK